MKQILMVSMLLLGGILIGIGIIYMKKQHVSAVPFQVESGFVTRTSPTPVLTTLFNDAAPAPEFVGITAWLNTDSPVTLANLRGKVVLIDFWTNQCINCIHTLPFVTKWYDTYHTQGFTVIGVHTPETAYEQSVSSIQTAIRTYAIHYPIAQDNGYATWQAYANTYWPAQYLIDKHGVIRRYVYGEGEYDQTELAIKTLLKEN